MQPFQTKPEGLVTALELCVLRGFEVKFNPGVAYGTHTNHGAHYLVTRVLPDKRGFDARMVVVVTQDKQGLDHCLALLRVPDSKLRLIAGETITVNMDYAVTAA